MITFHVVMMKLIDVTREIQIFISCNLLSEIHKCTVTVNTFSYIS